MNRWDLVNGLLAVTVAGLLALLWLPAADDSGPVLLDIDPGGISQVRVERRNLLVMQIERDAGVWRLTYPEDAAANPVRVGQLLAVARAPVVQQVMPSAGSDYGLTPGALTLQFDQSRMTFGDRDPTLRYRYVHVDGTIRVVDEAYYQLAGLPAGHYRAE